MPRNIEVCNHDKFLYSDMTKFLTNFSKFKNVSKYVNVPLKINAALQGISVKHCKVDFEFSKWQEWQELLPYSM
jgi:hypothetical protein